MGTVEDIIRQKKFNDDYQRAFVGLSYLNSVIDYVHQQMFKEFDVTPQQYNALRILRGQYPQPATVGLIKERMIDRNSDASRIVERLRKANFVERVTCENDRRAVDVVITEKGLDLLKKIDPIINSLSDPLRTLDKNEIAELNDILDRILSRWLEKEK